MDALVPTNDSFQRDALAALGDHAMRLKLAGTTSSASLINLGGSAKRLGHPDHRRTTVVITPPFGTR